MDHSKVCDFTIFFKMLQSICKNNIFCKEMMMHQFGFLPVFDISCWVRLAWNDLYCRLCKSNYFSKSYLNDIIISLCFHGHIKWNNKYSLESMRKWPERISVSEKPDSCTRYNNFGKMFRFPFVTFHTLG